MLTIQKISMLVVSVITLSTSVQAQITIGSGTGDDYLNTVTTAVPFLRIAPDARSGGMADVGIAEDRDKRK